MNENDLKCCGNCLYSSRIDMGTHFEETCLKGYPDYHNPNSHSYCIEWEFYKSEQTNKECNIEKVIRNGLVAILYSTDFGAGWYSWNREYKELLFHPKLVEMVENGRRNELTAEWVKKNLDIDIRGNGNTGLKIFWLPEGTAFRMEQYEGREIIIYNKTFNLMA